MRTRRLGRTGLTVSELGFGCIRFGGVDGQKVTRLVNRAMEAGITCFDTAEGYGDSEAKLGRALGRRRKEAVVITKTHRRGRKEAAAAVDQSLKRLRTDYLDVCLCHDCTDRTDYEAAMSSRGSLSALKKAKKAGKVRSIGISAHDFVILTDAAKSGQFDVIELEYSANNPEAAEKLLPLAERLDIGTIVMKPLGGGHLVVPAGRRKLGRDDLSARDALRFVLADPHVSTVVPGIQRFNELEQNLCATRMAPPRPTELKSIQRRASLFGKEFCRGCGYCLPCPQRIPIPKILRSYAEFTHMKSNWAARTRARIAYPRIKRNMALCKDCAQCEERCPYRLNIREQLRQADEMLAG